MTKGINLDYSVIEDVLYINSVFVEKNKRRKGLGSEALKEIEAIAKKDNCTKIITPSDLSKIALNFWLKNQFQCIDIDDYKKIKLVLNSSNSDNYIFDVDGNSIIELSKSVS